MEKKRKRMLVQILTAVAILIVVLIIVVALQPSSYRVARSATIAAPPEALFAQVNDFHNWDAWSPWARIDPNMQQTFSGAPAGSGAVYAWVGNSEVGEGRMTILESRPSELVRINLEFFKPFAGVAAAEFTFKPQGEQTVVTWSMEGQKNFMAKAVHMVMNMDKMLGGQFEKGLSQMQTAVKSHIRS